jgi:hypothetical protein
VPTKLARQAPLSGAFFADRTSLTGSAEYLEKFREAHARFTGAVSASKKLDTVGWDKADLKAQYADEVFITPAGQARFRDAKRRLDSLGRDVRAVYDDMDALPDQKRAALDRLYEEMEDTARWALGAPRLPRRRAPVATQSKGGRVQYGALPGVVR